MTEQMEQIKATVAKSTIGTYVQLVLTYLGKTLTLKTNVEKCRLTNGQVVNVFIKDKVLVAPECGECEFAKKNAKVGKPPVFCAVYRDNLQR